MLRAAVSRLARRIRQRRQARSGRLESFGAIVQLLTPRALVFVDRAEARWLGLADEDTWRDQPDEHDGDIGATVLSAPLEAHLQLTNRCDAGCTGCYTAATPSGGSNEMGEDGWMKALEELAGMGVFHLALGGGESADLPWLPRVAARARELGMIPNLTTSGLSNVDRIVESAELFGQINISMDGLGEAYARVRGFDGFDRADAALRRLRQVKREIGINVVVTRHTFDQIDGLFAYARERRLSEVELLRFKPSGRGSRAYDEMRCTDEQHRALLPTVLEAARRHRVRVKLDCSYTPMIAFHRPSRELLQTLAVYGCVGGDFLVGAKANGTLSACSFATSPPGVPKVTELASYWDNAGAFPTFRSWREADEPCRRCEFHDLCRGGCKAVSRQVHGDERRPDPECPFVVDWVADHPRQGAARARLPVVR